MGVLRCVRESDGRGGGKTPERERRESDGRGRGKREKDLGITVEFWEGIDLFYK